MPRVPVAYGQYEIGRSSRPKLLHSDPNLTKPSPWSRDGMPQQMEGGRQVPTVSPQGDPGQYYPYMYEDAGTNPEHNGNNSSAMRKPFDSTEVRELRASLFGLETPSVGKYPVFQPDKTIGQLDDAVRYPLLDANVSVFRSTSPQRPPSTSKVPGPDHYSPIMGSIQPVIGNPGASMRNAADRFFESKYKNITPEGVGPGTYPLADFEKTLLEDCQEHIRRSSALSNTKVAFQSTMPQRPGFFYNPGQSPDVAPGCYEPLEPRLKDLTGEARRQVM